MSGFNACGRASSCRRTIVAGIVIGLGLSIGSVVGYGAEADEESSRKPSQPYADIVLEDKPVGYWRFSEASSDDDGEPDVVRNSAAGNEPEAQLHGEIQGTIGLQEAGPRPERFPAFEEENAAIAIYGQKGYVRVRDPGEGSPLDFDEGDSITLEAWVFPQAIDEGRQVYLVGKGRTGNSGFAADNQNYALRLTGKGGTARISFLFRNADNRSGQSADFHRWTSDEGFVPGGDWHHVAVTYTFGEKESLRAYLDGRPVTGTWDMGGATEKGPVVDDDDLWIGSSMGGNPGSTFHGLLDEVALYRTALSPERIRLRYDSAPHEILLADADLPEDGVLVEVLEGIPDKRSWAFTPPPVRDRYVEPAFALPEIPRKYSQRGVQTDRTNPFMVRATGLIELPAGEHQLLLRTRSAGRVYLDGNLVLETPFHSISGSAHGRIRDVAKVRVPHIRALQTGDSENVATIESPGQVHRIRVEVIVGGGSKRPEMGEMSLSISGDGEHFKLLSPVVNVPLTDNGWTRFAKFHRQRTRHLNAERRTLASVEEREYWAQRHKIAREIVAAVPGPQVPEVSAQIPVHNDIDRFIGQSLREKGIDPALLSDDWAFLRRVTLDVIGTIPTPEQVREFFDDAEPGRRSRYIDRLLDHPGWADHWVGYWQDVLAENPNIVNPTLNNTGPFRWWIHESFEDNKPFDRFATELIMMEGSRYYGGPGGFEMATQNDAPMAAKAHIVGQAFLGMEMKCARCHDAPFRDFKQEDLFQLAAMLKRSPQPVPMTSSIPLSDEALESLIVNVTLKPGTNVAPRWPFEEVSSDSLIPESVVRNPNDSREELAALITSPRNERFPQVIVNRLWHRYLGRGIVEPVDDWDHPEPSHPELLEYLARELVLNNYDLKHVTRLILNSHAYQRTPHTPTTAERNQKPLFQAPVRRRMTAEQILDSLFVAANKNLNAGEMNIDVDSSRSFTVSLNLGEPERAWQFTSLSNERDRPSLSLPFAQGFVTLLETFGWRASRQDPLTVRDDEPMVLQPAALANGTVGRRITRLSDDSAFTELALRRQPVEQFVDQVFVRILTRRPTSDELEMFVDLLKDGYQDRFAPLDPDVKVTRLLPRSGVSWSNHLSPEANSIKIELERLVQAGDPPTPRLSADWRERAEDMLWVLINTPEFLYVP